MWVMLRHLAVTKNSQLVMVGNELVAANSKLLLAEHSASTYCQKPQFDHRKVPG